LHLLQTVDSTGQRLCTGGKIHGDLLGNFVCHLAVYSAIGGKCTIVFNAKSLDLLALVGQVFSAIYTVSTIIVWVDHDPVADFKMVYIGALFIHDAHKLVS
jgi:hypothetical protein